MNRIVLGGLLLLTLNQQLPAQPRTVNPAPHNVLINDIDESNLALHPIVPYLGPESVAVVEMDSTTLDALAAMKWLSFHFGPKWISPDVSFGDAAMLTRRVLKTLANIDTPKVYFVGSLYSFVNGKPLQVIPGLRARAQRSIDVTLGWGRQIHPTLNSFEVMMDGQTALIGVPRDLDLCSGRSSRTPGSRRNDLVSPLTQQRDSDHIAVLALSDHARQELLAFWPDRLPDPFPSDISPVQLVSDIERIVVNFDLPSVPESPQLRDLEYLGFDEDLQKELADALDATPHNADRFDASMPHGVIFEIEIETTSIAARKRVGEIVDKLQALREESRAAVSVTEDATKLRIRIDADLMAKSLRGVIVRQRPEARQVEVTDALRRMGLAIHHYHAEHDHFPPRWFTDREGRPLHGWRSALLPYLEQQATYERIHFDEPWDSEANKELEKTDVPTFAAGIDPSKHPAWTKRAFTRFRAPVFPGSIWHGEGPPKCLRDVTDGTANTIAIVHAPPSEGVVWTWPSDWIISEEDPVGDIFCGEDQISVLMLDGSTRVLRRNEIDNEKLKALLTFAGGEEFEW